MTSRAIGPQDASPAYRDALRAALDRIADLELRSADPRATVVASLRRYRAVVEGASPRPLTVQNAALNVLFLSIGVLLSLALALVFNHRSVTIVVAVIGIGATALTFAAARQTCSRAAMKVMRIASLDRQIARLERELALR